MVGVTICPTVPLVVKIRLFIYAENTNKRVGRTNILSFGAIGLYDIIFYIIFFPKINDFSDDHEAVSSGVDNA